MSTDLPDFVLSLEDYTEHIKMMVYADPGVGKTVFAGSAKTLILATENGTISAARQGAAGRGCKVIDCVGNWDRFEQAIDWLKKATKKDDFPFDWVAVDTGSELQELMKTDIVANEAEADATRNIDKVERQNYLEVQNRLHRYINYLNEMPVNVLILAGSMTTEDEEGNTFRMPMFHGKGNQVAMWVASQMHCYGYMHMVPVKTTKGNVVQQRRIQWNATDKVRAKDRFDVLGKPHGYTKNLNLTQLTDLILREASVEEEAPAKKAPAKKAAPKPASANEKEGNQ